MTINIQTRKTYTPICDVCGWRGTKERTEADARRKLDEHPCVTREAK